MSTIIPYGSEIKQQKADGSLGDFLVPPAPITPDEADKIIKVNTDGTDIEYKALIDLIYPVGSVYLSASSSIDPATLFGGTWEKIGNGKCLWSSDSSHAAGSTIDAGLPNIKGLLQCHGGTGVSRSNLWQPSGVFTACDMTGGPYGNVTSEGTADSVSRLKIDASMGQYDTKGNIQTGDAIVYGKSDTVQPPSFVVDVWKRTA